MKAKKYLNVNFVPFNVLAVSFSASYIIAVNTGITDFACELITEREEAP